VSITIEVIAWKPFCLRTTTVFAVVWKHMEIQICPYSTWM